MIWIFCALSLAKRKAGVEVTVLVVWWMHIFCHIPDIKLYLCILINLSIPSSLSNTICTLTTVLTSQYYLNSNKTIVTCRYCRKSELGIESSGTEWNRMFFRIAQYWCSCLAHSLCSSSSQRCWMGSRSGFCGGKSSFSTVNCEKKI